MQGLFRKYLWLVCQVKEAPKGITFEEINRRWKRNTNLNPSGDDIAKRTFRNWLAALPDELGVTIECERRPPFYYYISDYGVNNVNMLKWSLEMFSVGNMVYENKAIQDRILMDNIPSANETLSDICRAMRNGHKILLRHHRFGSEETQYTVCPYAVKIYQNRWYLVAHSEEKNKEYTYGLDRIISVEELDESFQLPENYSAHEKFRHCIGVYSDEDYPVETVRLKVKGYLPDYFDTLHLHQSQEEESRGEDYVIYRYKLKANKELINRLMTYGSACEVLEPESLRQALKTAHRQAWEMYG
ncbi:MAG: WYL domain-containing protein [Bacteroidales bacterium]|nr:WYL domain-containing protein [Bacteroidales bacterium]